MLGGGGWCSKPALCVLQGHHNVWVWIVLRGQGDKGVQRESGLGSWRDKTCLLNVKIYVCVNCL